MTSAISELALLARAERTGEFICTAEGIEVHVYLKRGEIGWATSSTEPYVFSRFLLEQRGLDPNTLRDVVESCRRDRLPLVETLIHWELISPHDAQAAIRHQILCALRSLAPVSNGRTLFLERASFAGHSTLTLPLGEFIPELPRKPSVELQAQRVPVPVKSGICTRVHDMVDGAAWVELLDGHSVIEESVAGGPRTPEAILEVTLADLEQPVDVVALRGSRETLMGVSMQQSKQSLWSMVNGNAVTFGAAISAILNIERVKLHPTTPALPLSVIDRTGDEAVSAELEKVLDRAVDVVAALVADGDQVVASAYRDPKPMKLFARRRKVFSLSSEGSASIPPPPSTPLDTMTASGRTVVTGERSVWAFGAELLAVPNRTVWLFVTRSSSQGIGWACLTSLCRSLSGLFVEGGISV